MVGYRGAHVRSTEFEYNFLGFHQALMNKSKLVNAYEFSDSRKFFNFQNYSNSQCLLQLIYGKEEVHLLFIESKVRGKGYGSKYLDILCSTADMMQAAVTLNIMSMYDEHKPFLNDTQLRRFYCGRGFRKTPHGEYLRKPSVYVR